jgi:hypothetical protein
LKLNTPFLLAKARASFQGKNKKLNSGNSLRHLVESCILCNKFIRLHVTVLGKLKQKKLHTILEELMKLGAVTMVQMTPFVPVFMKFRMLSNSKSLHL